MHFIAAELSYFYLATAIFYITLTTKATSLLTSKTESQVKFETACLPKNCKLPDCFCSGTKIPGNLSPQDVPQMILLTFQNAINDNFKIYQQLFKNLINPNKCAGRGTFFVSHNYTDYFYVQSLYALRHEIADNSVTWQGGSDYWAHGSVETWFQELNDEKKILSTWANVSAKDISGVRAPYLQQGGDNQFTAMTKASLKYDASQLTQTFSDKNHLLWPYTYDFDSIQDCVLPPCPTHSFPGIWQVPLPLLKDNSGKQCFTPEGCLDINTPEDAFRLLNDSFTSHYTTNRSPFIIPLGSLWLAFEHKVAGTLRFFDQISQFRDVYFVTVGQSLEWIRKPTSLSSIKKFAPWLCDSIAPSVCDEKVANLCFYDAARRRTQSAEAVFRLHTCLSCPSCYPALNDPFGRKC